MKVVKSNPPNIKDIEARFDLTGKKPCFAYGDTIYNPHGIDMTDDLIEHEMTHCERQKNDPKEWWKKYILDDDFRCLEELVAYARQYIYVCNNLQKDRNKRAVFLTQIAKEMSSPLYGNMITYQEALKALRNGTKGRV